MVADLLGNAIPPKHFVRFYDDDTSLVKEITHYLGAGFEAAQAGVIIVTKEHMQSVEERLAAGGYDLQAARQKGQYVALDAAETLSKFMRDGRPDERRFQDAVGSVIAKAQEQHSWVRGFGEMVSLLWADQQWDAALVLERLWNDLVKAHSFSLFCAYPKRFFNTETERYHAVCGEHSYVLPTDRQPT